LETHSKVRHATHLRAAVASAPVQHGSASEHASTNSAQQGDRVRSRAASTLSKGMEPEANVALLPNRGSATGKQGPAQFCIHVRASR